MYSASARVLDKTAISAVDRAVCDYTLLMLVAEAGQNVHETCWPAELSVLSPCRVLSAADIRSPSDVSKSAPFGNS